MSTTHRRMPSPTLTVPPAHLGPCAPHSLASSGPGATPPHNRGCCVIMAPVPESRGAGERAAVPNDEFNICVSRARRGMPPSRRTRFLTQPIVDDGVTSHNMPRPMVW
ncbi:hypothetical protein BJ912DRAFT_1056572 [Pholiota molesta]|nr:hypothetical protein BJ912DRAFT_1056572 [Pholiota molesta]